MWIEIFKGGRQTDSAGHVHDGNQLIRQALEKFDVNYHEPPVTIGHPKDNSPAYGWVESLKDQAGGLWAKLKGVAPEFKDAVQKGFFKKRSASFYPDGRLRHIGFLGGMPPAVKGLADLKFNVDEEFFCFEDADPVPAVEPETDGEPEGDSGDENQTGDDNMDLEAIKAELDAAKAALAAKDEEITAAVEQAKADFAEQQERSRVQAWVSEKVQSGVIPPALAEGFVEFVAGLDTGATFEFNDKQWKQTDWLMQFVEKAFEKGPFASMFKEAASKADAGVNTGAEADEALGRSIAAKVSPDAK